MSLLTHHEILIESIDASRDFGCVYLRITRRCLQELVCTKAVPSDAELGGRRRVQVLGGRKTTADINLKEINGAMFRK